MRDQVAPQASAEEPASSLPPDAAGADETTAHERNQFRAACAFRHIDPAAFDRVCTALSAAQKRVEELEAPRMFPLQVETPPAKPGPRSIPWEIAEEAYAWYSQQYGRQQSLERIAERGGFSWAEMDAFAPSWRARVDVVSSLRAQLAQAEAKLAETQEMKAAYWQLAERQTAQLAEREAEVSKEVVLRIKLADQLAERRAEIEKLRMQLAACGVLAGCNTPESLDEHSKMLPEYESGSSAAVAGAMRREIALRAEVELLKADHIASTELLAALREKAEALDALEKWLLEPDSCRSVVLGRDYQGAVIELSDEVGLRRLFRGSSISTAFAAALRKAGEAT